MIRQIAEIGFKSQPVVIVTGAFTGAVLAAQSLFQFSTLNMETGAGALVSVAMLRELGPSITALMLAGRVGASMAAEIGTMKVTEQVDALEAMAFSPIAYLVVPRLIAGMVMVPVLSIIAAFIGMISGWLAAISLADLTTFEFFKGARAYVSWRDFALPLAKSLLFGISIIMVACYQGLNSKQGAEGVGRAATNAAVSACLMILTLDFIMAKVILP